METSKNISVFLNQIKKEAQNQQKEIKKKADDYINTELKTAKAELTKEAEEFKEAEILKIKNEHLKELSLINGEFKKAVILKREENINKLKEELILKIKDYTKTKDYCEFLANSLKNILNKDENAVILAKKEDFENPAFKNYKNITLLEDSSIILGGIKAKSEKLAMVFDDTLDSRLNEACNSIYTKEELIIKF